MTANPASEPRGAERRREKRYEVQLKGDLGVDGEIHPVTIADISGSGALLTMPDPPEQGVVADLLIESFGDLEVKIMFCGDGMCGVMFTQPTLYRDALLTWLTQDVLEKPAP